MRPGPPRRKVIAALAVLLLIVSIPARAGRRGGKVVVETGLSHVPIKGELIAVKSDSLLILDDLGADTSVQLAYVRSVRVVRSSKGGIGAMLGLVVGAAGGYFGGYSAAVASGACPDCEAPLSGYGLGILGGLVGLGAGAVIGSAAGRDIEIPLGGLSKPEMTVQLKKLRRYARIAEPL